MPFIELDFDRMPQHVAVIMDGHGRWAKSQGKSRSAGHRYGMERLCKVVRTASDIGLDVLTLYAFSTENWKRPRPEVEILFGLLVEYLRREILELHQNGIRLMTIGDGSALPALARREVEAGKELTRNNTGMVLNIALNYGARDEIIKAAQSLAKEAAEGSIAPREIDEEMFASKLFTAGLPDPDLLIRTSGEQRLSNFMLYQLSYAEMVFTPLHWPDFTDEVFADCLSVYMARERRFGALKE